MWENIACYNIDSRGEEQKRKKIDNKRRKIEKKTKEMDKNREENLIKSELEMKLKEERNKGHGNERKIWSNSEHRCKRERIE